MEGLLFQTHTDVQKRFLCSRKYKTGIKSSSAEKVCTLEPAVVQCEKQRIQSLIGQ